MSQGTIKRSRRTLKELIPIAVQNRQELNRLMRNIAAAREILENARIVLATPEVGRFVDEAIVELDRPWKE